MTGGAMQNETKQILAWTVLPFAAVANGVVRDKTYGKGVGETAAHSLSVAPLAAVVGFWAGLVSRWWPLRSRRSAVRVGILWLALTLAFETGLGKARGVSTHDQLAEYDVRRGKLWPLALAVIAFAPLFHYHRHRQG
jgi:hypothetical protein